MRIVGPAEHFTMSSTVVEDEDSGPAKHFTMSSTVVGDEDS